jgi:hypothetical protein
VRAIAKGSLLRMLAPTQILLLSFLGPNDGLGLVLGATFSVDCGMCAVAEWLIL